MYVPKVYVTRQVQPEAIELLKEKCNVEIWESDLAVPRDVLLEKVKGVDAIFCTISDTIDAEVLDAAGEQLKVVATMSVGMHHISHFECTRRGIQVCNTPNVAADSAAEFTVTLLLMVARRCLEGAEAVVKGTWGLWKPMWICGTEIRDRTLGIIGFGMVGHGVARRLKPWGLKQILYHDITRNLLADDLNAKFVDFDTIWRESDFIVLTVALTGVTKGMVNKEVFAKMKKGAILINTSRGQIVDTEALTEALKSGHLGGAGLDVTDPQPLPSDHPLVGMDNCIITPHLATNSGHARLLMAKESAKNILAVFRNPGSVQNTTKYY